VNRRDVGCEDGRMDGAGSASCPVLNVRILLPEFSKELDQNCATYSETEFISCRSTLHWGSRYSNSLGSSCPIFFFISKPDIWTRSPQQQCGHFVITPKMCKSDAIQFNVLLIKLKCLLSDSLRRSDFLILRFSARLILPFVHGLRRLCEKYGPLFYWCLTLWVEQCSKYHLRNVRH
jgi:hypothetical protein